MTEDEAQRFRYWCACGVPAREMALINGGLSDTVAMKFAKEWVTSSDDTPMLVLAGPKGVGKTVAAVWAMMMSEPPPPPGCRVWPAERGPRFRHVSDVAELGLFNKDDERKARGDIKNTKCLVVDDVGVEYMSEMFLALWDSIVNARYGSMGFTIFTTNLTAEMFARRYGERVYDRIRGRGAWYDVDGESLRGRSVH